MSYVTMWLHTHFPKPFFLNSTMKTLLIVTCLLFCNFLATADDHPAPLAIGTAAPDFNLKGVDGKMYSLKSFAKAKILAIVFTCNHCPTAQAYEERIKQLVIDYGKKGVQVVAIQTNDAKSVRFDELGYADMGDTYEEMQIRAKDHHFNFPYLNDGVTQATTNKYGAVATPHIFIFDKARKLQYNGRIDDVEKPTGTPKNLDARNAIEALLAGTPVPVTATKTFGCSIKWAEKEASVVKELAGWKKEEVTLETIDDQGIKDLIANKTNKVRLINVWATWCGPCVGELPEFVKINHMFKRRDFEFITISADKPDKKDRALAILKNNYVSAKNYIFNSEDIYKLIELIDPKWQGALPYTMIIEPDGKILYAKQAGIKPLEIKRTIVESKYIGRVY